MFVLFNKYSFICIYPVLQVVFVSLVYIIFRHKIHIFQGFDIFVNVNIFVQLGVVITYIVVYLLFSCEPHAP